MHSYRLVVSRRPKESPGRARDAGSSTSRRRCSLMAASSTSDGAFAREVPTALSASGRRSSRASMRDIRCRTRRRFASKRECRRLRAHRDRRSSQSIRPPIRCCAAATGRRVAWLLRRSITCVLPPILSRPSEGLRQLQPLRQCRELLLVQEFGSYVDRPDADRQGS